MFTVQNISGLYTPYVRGVIRSKRTASQVRPVSAVDSQAPEEAFSVQEGSETKQSRVSDNYQGKSAQPDLRRRVLLAKDLMKPDVFTIPENTTLNEAWNIVAEKRFRHLLVSGSNRLLKGILSDRDILKFFALHKNEINSGKTVSDLMHTDILSATPETEIRQIAKVLFDEKIGCMPILTADRKLTGIITRSDILRSLLVHQPLELWI